MTKDEALDLALEALETLARYENPETRVQVRNPKDNGPVVTMYPHKVATDAISAIKQVRSAPTVQEPVAIPREWRTALRKLAFMARTSGGTAGHDSGLVSACEEAEALLSKPYTTPPAAQTDIGIPISTPAAQRQWVGLTDEEIDIAFDDTQEGGGFDEFARAIEQRLKEKNT